MRWVVVVGITLDGILGHAAGGGDLLGHQVLADDLHPGVLRGRNLRG